MDPLTHLRNFLRIDDRLATSGMPQPGDFAALRQAGFDVVINLALPMSDNALPNEGELVSAQGMTYVHMPVKFDAPQPADFERFTRVLDACAGQKVFVHCAATCASRHSSSCIACGRARTEPQRKVISRKTGNQTAYCRVDCRLATQATFGHKRFKANSHYAKIQSPRQSCRRT